MANGLIGNYSQFSGKLGTYTSGGFSSFQKIAAG